MKLNIVILVLGATLLCVELVNCVAACTPATCGSNPVIAHFQYENCTGEVTYSPINGANGVCSNGELVSWNDEAYYEYYSYTDRGEVCDTSASNVSYSITMYKFGSCMRVGRTRRSQGGEFSSLGSSSFMYLLNVNSSFTSPQPFDNQNVDEYSSNYAECYSHDNCTLANGQPAVSWATYYGATYCGNPIYSYFNPTERFSDCLKYYDVSYIRSFCLDARTAYVVFYEDASCTRPNSISAERYTCDASSSNTEAHCTATPTPFPSFGTPTAPSASPVPRQWSLFLIASALLLAILSL